MLPVKIHALQTATRETLTVGLRVCVILLICRASVSAVAGTGIYPRRSGYQFAADR